MAQDNHNPLRNNDLTINGLANTQKCFSVVVFDMDGVLVDSEPVHFESTVRLLNDRFGIRFTESDNREFLGSTDRRMFEILRDRHRLGPTVEELVEMRKSCYAELVADGHPWREGILPLIHDLANDHHRLAVASSGLRRIIEMVLSSGGITDHFATIVSGDDVRTPKPSPEIYLEAARRLNVEPAECVALEDTDVGVRSAKSAGMTVIAFPNDTTRDMDFAPADVTAQSVDEIRQYLGLSTHN